MESEIQRTKTSSQFSENDAKTNALFFPIFYNFYSLEFPAAIGLYWMVTALFSIIQQYLIYQKNTMLNYNDLEKIKKETEEFFKKMTFEVEIEFLPQREETLPVNLKTDEPQILIGERGQTLVEIQHLLKAILKRKITAEPFYIDLDINIIKRKKTNI